MVLLSTLRLGAFCLFIGKSAYFFTVVRLQTKGPAHAPAHSDSLSKAYAAAPTVRSAAEGCNCGRAASSGKATASTSSMPLA